MEVYTRIMGGGFCTIASTFGGLPRIRDVVVPYEGLYCFPYHKPSPPLANYN